MQTNIYFNVVYKYLSNKLVKFLNQLLIKNFLTII
jgi:hypothetical protein